MSLKICYLMPHLVPTPSGGVVGGAAVNCVTLALELKRRNVDIELFALVSKDAMACLSGQPSFEILRPLATCGGGLVGKGLGTMCALRRALKDRLRETHFDIIHSHSGTYPYAVVPLVADRRACVRLHSLYCPLGAGGGVYSKWWERSALARLALGRLDRVVAATENVQRSLQDAGVRQERIELVRMCVDTRRFHPVAKPETARYFTDNGQCTRILFIGNASKEKGLLELLAAVALLKERKIAVSLIAAVENQCEIKEYVGGYKQARMFIRQAGIEGQVRFVGLVDSIERLYAESDLVVTPWKTSRGPSDYPMVVLEAMAMGKCVVSTPVGGCPELLAGGQVGILTRDFSIESIASAIELAARDLPTRKRLEAGAMERVRHFSASASAEHLLVLYDRLLKQKNLIQRPM